MGNEPAGSIQAGSVTSPIRDEAPPCTDAFATPQKPGAHERTLKYYISPRRLLFKHGVHGSFVAFGEVLECPWGSVEYSSALSNVADRG